MPKFHALLKPKHQQNGEHKNGLQLEAEGQREVQNREDRPVLHGKGDGEDGERDVNAVALAPERPVQDHGGQEQNHEETGQKRGFTPLYGTEKPHRGVGQEHVEEDAEQLDEVQVPNRKVGEEAEEVHIGDVVIPKRIRK